MYTVANGLSKIVKGRVMSAVQRRQAGCRLISPIRLEPKNKQAASWDYALNKSMLLRVKIFKLTINAAHCHSRELSRCRAAPLANDDRFLEFL